MEPTRHNFKFSEQGRRESTLVTTMERAIDIARDRVITHQSELKLSVETRPGKFLVLGTYAYFPERDNERFVISIPKLPKAQIIDIDVL